MKIFLTNDDGIEAKGINTLAKVFGKENEIFVLAPQGERSGSSCSLSLKARQRLIKKSENFWALDGTPADCVLFALNSGIFPKVDMIFSGINSGANLGTDIVYSGTCGAARQGAICGVKSIALSVDKDSREEDDNSDEFYFESFANFVLKNLDVFYSIFDGNFQNQNEQNEGLSFFLNVNAPARKSYNGVKVCEPSFRKYGDKIGIEKSGDFFYSTWTSEQKVKSFGNSCCDAFAVQEGFVSLSAILTKAVSTFFECEKKFVL